MEKFSEESRYNYPLNENSIVFDLGVYEGNFSKLIYEKYNCNIYGFEPINKFFNNSYNNLKNYTKIKLFNFGVGGNSREEVIAVRNDSSSIFLESATKEVIKIKSISEILEELNINHVDLIKINTEGCEYEILEHIIEHNLVDIFDNIQVQFHCLNEDCILRRSNIQNKLSNTHYLTYNEYFIWENWKHV